MRDVTVLDDAVAGAHLAALRDRTTPADRFRDHARQLGRLLTQRAVLDLPTTVRTVRTPLAETGVTVPSCPAVAVPVLRAGLGLLPGLHDVLPEAPVGMVGLERDPATLRAHSYFHKVPPLAGSWVLVLEPMLATGGSAADAIAALDLEGALGVSLLSVVGTPPALDRLADAHPGLRVLIGAVDPQLDDDGYIVPGLGDFGDRVFGTPH